jgi:hypothetical protein
MRKVGAAEASFNANGQLLTLKLGDAPQEEPDLDELDARREARERSDAAQRLDRMLGAVPKIRPFAAPKRH